MSIDDAASVPVEENAGHDALEAALNAAFESAENPVAETSTGETGSEAITPKGPDNLEKTVKADENALPEAGQPDVAPTGMQPPEHWTADRKAAFAKLAPEAQSTLLGMAKDLEAGFTRKSQERANDLRLAENVRSVITDDLRYELQNAGIDEASGIAQLVNYWRAAKQNPAQYAQWFISQTGLSPEQIFPQLSAGDTGDIYQADPAISQISQSVSDLGQRFEQYQQEQRMAAQQREQQIVRTSIERFKSETDADGNALRPYFDKVQSRMARYVVSDPDISALADYGDRMQAAYDAAIAADPEIRAEAMAATAALQAKQAAAARARDAKAIKANSSQPVTRDAKKRPTLDEILDETLAS